MTVKLGTQVFFETLDCIFSGKIEKELVNSYILCVETTNKQFIEMYHGRIVVRKKNCYSNKKKVMQIKLNEMARKKE